MEKKVTQQKHKQKTENKLKVCTLPVKSFGHTFSMFFSLFWIIFYIVADIKTVKEHVELCT